MDVIDGAGLFTLNELLIPDSMLPVFVAVIKKVPPGEIVTACADSTPAVNAEVVVLPEVKIPLEEISTVPVKLFGPLLQMLLFKSRAVIFILKDVPATWVLIFPPVEASTRKLFTAPGLTINELLVPVEPPPVFVAVIEKVPVFEIVKLLDESTPATNAAVVPDPDCNVPVDVISTVPVKVFEPVLHVLFSPSRAVIIISNDVPAV